MKKRLLMLLSLFMAVTSVGWLHAQDAKAIIRTDLTGALVGKPIVFGVTTLPNGVSASEKVRVEIGLSGDADAALLQEWDLQYYEPNLGVKDFVTWDAENNVYVFAPSEGFDFKDATSYFKMTPTKAGDYTYTLKIKKVSGGEVIAKSNHFTLKVAEGLPIQGYGLATIASEADTQYASLATAVHFAKDNSTINLSSGNFSLVPGTEIFEGQSGWFLPIDKNGLKIIGQGTGSAEDGSGATVLVSNVETPNSNYSNQNFITIFSDDVTLEGLVIISKKEANKTIQVSGKNVTLRNLSLPLKQGTNFAGSIYFASEDIGKVTMEQLSLNKGRITFSGAKKGEVSMDKVNIFYDGVKFDDETHASHMGALQEYTPFGGLVGKSGLTFIKVNSVRVIMANTADSYQFDAATIANLPAGVILNLNKGTYSLKSQLVFDKPLEIYGSVNQEGASLVTIQANADGWTGGTNDKNNLLSIEGAATGNLILSDLCIKASKASGINAQSKMNTTLRNVTLQGNTNAGLLVHSTVNAFGLKTLDNKWGGVNIDKGNPEYTRKFTFDDASSFAEPSKIWAEKANVSDVANLVAGPQGWSHYEGLGGSEGKTPMYYWTNASLSTEVADAAALKEAIKSARPGQIITLTEASYGDENNIQPFGTIKTANVTIKAKDGVTPKVYGTFKILAEGCTIDGLDMSTKSDGSAALKNIIDVVAMSATITNNTFNMLEPTTGNVSNGLGIWPYGTAAKPSYVIKGNKFIGFKATVTDWSSAAITVVEGLELSRFGLTASDKSKVVVIDNELEMWTGNTFENCFTDYVHSNWESTAANAAGKAPLYSFAAMSSTADALQTAVNYSGDKAQIYAKGKYELTNQLTIKKSLSIQGVITDKDTTTIAAVKSSWTGSDGSTKHLISIQANNVSLKNIIVDGTNSPADGSGSGINVYKATGVTLDNIVSRNNKAAGLIVNGSAVTATNFRTSGNVWYGVNVDKGEGVQSEPVFTIGAGCSFAEKVAILSDKRDAPASYVIGSGWFKTTQGEGENKVSVWFNGATTGLDFAITSVPANVIYGQANLPLLTNVDKAYYEADNVKISILETGQQVVNIKTETGQPDSLEILKPGKVTLSLAVGDTTVTQSLTVHKKTLTITGITTKKARDYNGSQEVDLNTDMTVNGLIEKHKDKKDVVTAPTKGEALSANAGLQPVKVEAKLGDSYKDYYELAEITGVIDTIKKVELTVTATVKASSTASSTEKKSGNDTVSVNYGTLPTFDVKYGDFVNSESADKEGVLSGALKYNCSATTTSLAGTYSVTPSGYTATNYDIKYVSAPFKIKAIAPTVEMTGVEVVSLGTSGGNNASVKVTGRVTSNGGTEMKDLKGNFKVKTGSNDNYEDKNLSLNIDNNGVFSTTLTGLSSAETSIQAFAKVGELENTPADDKAMSVNLKLQLQNVSFASTFSTLTYGIDPISLSAKDFEPGAKVTFATSDVSILAIEDSNKMSVKKPGVATITVTATKDNYMTAVAKQTITVNKKALAVTATISEKKYDGKTDVKVTGTLPKQEGLKAATLRTNTVNANFASKNVGSSIVKLSGEFELSDDAKDYYELIQPTNLTGTIAPGGKVTVVVSDVTRRFNETTLRYDLKYLADGKELPSSEYTGFVSVTEGDGGTYNVSVAEFKAPNYNGVEASKGSGNIEIIKGTPKVLTYNVSNSEFGALLVAAEGWSDAQEKVVYEADNKAHATVIYNGGKDSIVGKSLAKVAPPTMNWNFSVVTPVNRRMMKATKAATNVAKETVQYGQTATFAKATDVSFESSNPNVFVVKESADGKSMMIETIGVGTAAIIARGTGESAGVTCLQVEVTPKPITLEAKEITKVYDGTTTAHVTLTLAPGEELVGASIDLTGVSFNFETSNVGNGNGNGITVHPSKDIVLKNDNKDLASAANYTLIIPKLTGEITPRELTFTGTEVNKFYDGTNTAELTDYSATGLIEGETVPALTATFKDASGKDAKDVATGLKVTLAPKDGNYTLKDDYQSKIKGNIVKSTIDATLPAGASNDDNLAANVALVVRETGKKVTKGQIGFTPLVSHEGSGNNTVYYISGGDNDNYSVVYDKNQIGFKADQGSGGGDQTTVSVSSVSLDKTELTLPRLGTYTLKATINPSDASDKSVTWKSSDESVATVDANGKVTALKVGKATITVTTVDGGKTASCEVTVDFATGLEEALANTQVYAKQGNIYVNPVQPLQLTIVNMIGKIVYNARISSYAQIPVAKGIYIVKLTNAGNTVVTKVNVY